jgi:ribosomal protein S18 acetylase RimI-like enzyme
MVDADLMPLAALYQKVWIRHEESRSLLDPEAPRNFERTGGMFLIQDEESLLRLATDPTEYVWVAREGVRVLGALWCGLSDEKYADTSRIRAYEGCEDLPGRVTRGLLDGTLYFSKEIVVAPGERGRKIAEALLGAAMRFFHARGFRQSCGEVYYVRAMRDEAGERKVGLFNGASCRMLERTGCRIEGEFPPCVVNADGFDALISMRIVRWSSVLPAIGHGGAVHRMAGYGAIRMKHSIPAKFLRTFLLLLGALLLISGAFAFAGMRFLRDAARENEALLGDHASRSSREMMVNLALDAGAVSSWKKRRPSIRSWTRSDGRHRKWPPLPRPCMSIRSGSRPSPCPRRTSCRRRARRTARRSTTCPRPKTSRAPRPRPKTRCSATSKACSP